MVKQNSQVAQPAAQGSGNAVKQGEVVAGQRLAPPFVELNRRRAIETHPVTDDMVVDIPIVQRHAVRIDADELEHRSQRRLRIAAQLLVAHFDHPLRPELTDDVIRFLSAAPPFPRCSRHTEALMGAIAAHATALELRVDGIGDDKPFLTAGVLSKILSGWQARPLFQWQTGAPLTATLSGNFSNSGGTTDRPDAISDPNKSGPRTPQKWFNTEAFIQRPASGAVGATYSFGNTGTGTIESPGMTILDVSVVRTLASEW